MNPLFRRLPEEKCGKGWEICQKKERNGGSAKKIKGEKRVWSLALFLWNIYKRKREAFWSKVCRCVMVCFAKHFSAFDIEEIWRDCCFRGWPENITGVAGLQMCCHRLNHLVNTQNSLDKVFKTKTKELNILTWSKGLMEIHFYITLPS